MANTTITIQGECRCGRTVSIDRPADRFMVNNSSNVGEWVRCAECRRIARCYSGSSEGDHL